MHMGEMEMLVHFKKKKKEDGDGDGERKKAYNLIVP